MIINRSVYYIYKRSKPIVFHAGSGKVTENINEIELYGSRHDAEEELSNFDEPEYYDIEEAKIQFTI